MILVTESFVAKHLYRFFSLLYGVLMPVYSISASSSLNSSLNMTSILLSERWWSHEDFFFSTHYLDCIGHGMRD